MRAMATNGDGAVRPDPTSDLQLLVDSAPSLIHTSRPDGYLDFFNQTWLTYVGRSLEDLQGWKWTAFIHPEDVQGIVEKWRASLASGEPFLDEARVLRADGEYRWMLHHKVAARDGCGQIAKWYGSSIDIEDRKRAEVQLRRNTEELQRSEFAYRFDFHDRSIAFSGDTAPVEVVARLAKGADILVHEAMYVPVIEAYVHDRIAKGSPIRFDDYMAHMKIDQSPVEDVGRIAKEAGVQTLVLSHLTPGIDGIQDETWRNLAAKLSRERLSSRTI